MARHEDRFHVVPAAYVFLRDGTKILLIRRANTGYMDGMYSLPSGHLEGGEPASVAAAREALEEVGVTIAPEDIEFAHLVHYIAEEGDHERVSIMFEAKKWQGEPRNCEPDKCDDIQWFDLHDLPTNTIPLVKSVLEDVANGVVYSELYFEK